MHDAYCAAQHSRRGKAECRAARQVGAQRNACPQRQRKQRLLRREGKRQPGAGHLLGIQRVDKEEYGQPPLCPAGEKAQRIAHALAQLHGHSPPSCYDMHTAGGSMPPSGALDINLIISEFGKFRKDMCCLE